MEGVKRVRHLGKALKLQGKLDEGGGESLNCAFLYDHKSHSNLVPLALHWVLGLYEEWGIRDIMDLGLVGLSMRKVWN